MKGIYKELLPISRWEERSYSLGSILPEDGRTPSPEGSDARVYRIGVAAATEQEEVGRRMYHVTRGNVSNFILTP